MHSEQTDLGPTGPGRYAQLDRIVMKAAKIAALVGGGFIMLIAIMTFFSVLGRYFLGRPIFGSYELVEWWAGIAVISFFPYTHSMRANVSATLFTENLSEFIRNLMDFIANLAFLLISVLLLWRITVGFIEKWEGVETTMALGLPQWLFYAPAVVWMALLVLVAMAISARDLARILK
jgi:TRAP-type C4-dicarboxylate transport system permease small subunit